MMNVYLLTAVIPQYTSIWQNIVKFSNKPTAHFNLKCTSFGHLKKFQFLITVKIMNI